MSTTNANGIGDRYNWVCGHSHIDLSTGPEILQKNGFLCKISEPVDKAATDAQPQRERS